MIIYLSCCLTFTYLVKFGKLFHFITAYQVVSTVIIAQDFCNSITVKTFCVLVL